MKLSDIAQSAPRDERNHREFPLLFCSYHWKLASMFSLTTMKRIAIQILYLLVLLLIVFILRWFWSGEFTRYDYGGIFSTSSSGGGGGSGLTTAQRLEKLAAFVTESLAKLDKTENGTQIREFSTENCSTGVRRQMAESERVWRASKRKRLNTLREIGPKFVLHPWGVHSLTTFWDFFVPAYQCPAPVERIGRLGDGGKWVCAFGQLATKNPCIVYSFGLGHEVSFEAEVLERTQCHLRMYDHTINTKAGPAADLVTRWPDRALLFGYGLSVADTENMRTLRSEMEANGDQLIDLLKIDVEGAEFESMRAILADFKEELPFKQLLVEVHVSQLPRNDMLLEFSSWFAALEDAGLRAFVSEPNQIPMLTSGWQSYVSAYEYGFLNVKSADPEYFCSKK